jgi:hypothetical protein
VGKEVERCHIFFQKDTWIRYATKYMTERAGDGYEFDSGLTVEILPVGGKSVTIKVNGQTAGSAGTPESMVNLLCSSVGEQVDQEDFMDFMHEILFPYDNDDDLEE